MRREPSAVRSTVSHDHPDRYRQRVPPTFRGDPASQPTSLIHLANQLVDVDDIRLEFDDDQGSMNRMPGENIDDPALAVDREGDLRLKDPVRQLGREPSSNGLVEPGVSAAHQAIEIGASRPRVQGHLDVEDASHRNDGPEREPFEMPAFNP